MEKDLLPNENARPDGPVASEDEDEAKKESDDDVKVPLDSKETTPSPTSVEIKTPESPDKTSQPENPDATKTSESPV